MPQTENPNLSKAMIGYVRGIDGLRAIAVVAVLLFHLNHQILPGGYAGVDIFFVISGFVVTTSVLDREKTSFGSFVAHFYARRVLRIMPALIVMLIGTIIVWGMFAPESFLSSTSGDVAKSAFFGISNIVLAFNAEDYFSSSSDYNPFLHTWSLGVEEQFYLIFPFIMFWRQRRLAAGKSDYSAIVVAVLSLASLLASGILSTVNERYAFYLIPSRFWELGVGVFLALSATRWQTWLAANRTVFVSLACTSVLLLIAALAIPELPGYFPFPIAILSVCGTAGLIAVVTANQSFALSRLLSSGIPKWLGKASYSIYLWHWPVFVMMRWTSGLNTLTEQLIAGALALSLGFGSYFLVEQSVQKNLWLKSMPRWKVLAVGLSVVVFSAAVGYVLVRGKNHYSMSVTAHARDDWYPYFKPTKTEQNRCDLKIDISGFSGATLSKFSPTNCTVAPRGGRLFVVGDSHTGALAYILRQIAQSDALTTFVIERPGCPFLSLQGPSQSTSCDDFNGRLYDLFNRELHSGDVVVLASLRVRRITNQHAAHVDRSVTNEEPSTEKIREAESFMQYAQQKGVNVMWFAPSPIFPAPPFRCSDWFNKASPACEPGLSIPRGEMETRRLGVVTAMSKFAQEHSNVSVFDPLPILCNSNTCDAVDDQGPRFFDGDHLSGRGNELLLPSFRERVLQLVR